MITKWKKYWLRLLINSNLINVEDIISKIKDFPNEKKEFLFSIIRKILKTRPFHRNQIRKIMENSHCREHINKENLNESVLPEVAKLISQEHLYEI